MNALSTLRSINSSTAQNQSRITTGLAVQSAKDNAAYFSISKTLSSDSGMYKAVDEGLTLTKNSIATARAGAEEVARLATKFTERVAFAQSGAVSRADVQLELDELVQQIGVTIEQATFNGNDLVTGATSNTVVTGVSRDAAGSLSTTSVTFQSVDLTAIETTLSGISLSATGDISADLITAEGALADAISAATTLGVAENTMDSQKEFLKSLSAVLDEGVGAIVDADMEKEAARSQALQVQSQVAIQALSMANQQPQQLLSLFR